MGKVGIVTFTYGDNYGQRLQNLAVQEVARLRGYEPYTFQQWQKRPILQNGKAILKRMVSHDAASRYKRAKAFAAFDSEYIRYAPNAIGETTGPKDVDGYDFFIAGSDQIWNPLSPDVNQSMFLTFAPRSKRIALSPSIASPVIPEEKRQAYRGYLDGFERLSVREENGAKLIKELTGRDAEILIDPTLMFDADFWRKYARRPDFPIPEKYALVYFLGEAEAKQKIDKLCGYNNLEVINLLQDRRMLELGPCEFLWLLDNASVVFSDSFHGTIFSVLFNVPFLHAQRVGLNDMSSRFETLFEKLGLDAHDLGEHEIGDGFDCDYSEVDARLNLERAQFNRYLDECIVSAVGV